MTYDDAKQAIEARYESGLLSFLDRDFEIEALDYAHGEAMTAADIEKEDRT